MRAQILGQAGGIHPVVFAGDHHGRYNSQQPLILIPHLRNKFCLNYAFNPSIETIQLSDYYKSSNTAFMHVDPRYSSLECSLFSPGEF